MYQENKNEYNTWQYKHVCHWAAYNRQAAVSADSTQVIVLRLAVAGQVEGVRGGAEVHDEVNHL